MKAAVNKFFLLAYDSATDPAAEPRPP